MKSALVILISGTIFSGLAATYASTVDQMSDAPAVAVQPLDRAETDTDTDRVAVRD